ncbi:MAG: ABC transporter substrate-binding protein [Pseudolysinimonas sp.]|uniref:ABC transporter substrate-binding protein n=1 Tax=Pseudolysinimonas sp. TaxID=2680009 RepID=UPI003C74C4AC
MSRSLPRRVVAVATALAVVAVLSACATGGAASSPIRVGWSGEFPPLDPAASDSFGSFAFLTQIYPSLLVVEAEQPDPVPEIAEWAEWTEEGLYTVVLKPGLEFANGNALTASDVKFSLERQLALRSEDGAWRRLANLDSIEIVDDTTIKFRLGVPLDTGFPFVLAGPAGLVLDEETFFADELTSDDDIVEAQPFAGPYALEARSGDRVDLIPFAGFGGAPLAATALELRVGGSTDLTRQLSEASIDVLTGRLAVDTVEALADDDEVDMARAASGRVRMLAFDLGYMPFGSRTETPNADQAAAVRVAISEIVDRQALADSIGANWVNPAFGYIPDGVPGSADVFTAVHGDGEGGPDLEQAAAVLAAQQIATPVELSIHVALDQVGEPGSAEVAGLAEQLDDSGLFSVTVIETDSDELGAALVAGEVQSMFTSLLPGTGDPREYLEPFRSAGLLAPGFSSSGVDALLDRSTTEADPAVRAATWLETQAAIAEALPAIPITQGVRVVFVRGTISGFGLDDALALDLSRLRR